MIKNENRINNPTIHLLSSFTAAHSYLGSSWANTLNTRTGNKYVAMYTTNTRHWAFLVTPINLIACLWSKTRGECANSTLKSLDCFNGETNLGCLAVRQQ